MFRYSIMLLLVTTVPLSFSTGCSKAGPDLVPVSGVIRVDGKPLPNVSVSFIPDKSQDNQSPYQPYGGTDAEGRYQLKTLTGEGAVTGWYKVIVIPASAGIVNGMPAKTPPPPFDAKYTNPEHSDLKVEVLQDGQEAAYDLELRR